MSKLVFDRPADRVYETGIQNGVIFPIRYGRYQDGVVWNGLTAVNERPSGSEPNALYADNIKYLNLLSDEEFAATVEAYSYPNECRRCLGETEIAQGVYIAQQSRQHFGLVYKTMRGNAESQDARDYKLHLLFNCMVGPSEKNFGTVNETPEAITFSWELQAEKQYVSNFKPSANLVLDSVKMTKAGFYNLLRFIEDQVYGTDSSDPHFLSLTELTEIVPQMIYLRDNENGAILDSAGNRIQSFVFD